MLQPTKLLILGLVTTSLVRTGIISGSMKVLPSLRRERPLLSSMIRISLRSLHSLETSLCIKTWLDTVSQTSIHLCSQTLVTLSQMTLSQLFHMKRVSNFFTILRPFLVRTKCNNFCKHTLKVLDSNLSHTQFSSMLSTSLSERISMLLRLQKSLRW